MRGYLVPFAIHVRALADVTSLKSDIERDGVSATGGPNEPPDANLNTPCQTHH